MAGEVDATGLSCRVRLERRAARVPSFVLDVALEFPAGITVIFGPSGAGKSTLLDCIAGLLHPQAGRIALGAELVFDSQARIDVRPERRHVGYVFQSLALFPHMSAQENIAYGLSKLAKEEQTMRTGEIARAFRIDALQQRKPAELSGGEQQRVALARSLVTRPRVLLLDEPMTGLDADLKSSIINDLLVWNALQKIPILYVTHNREETLALAARVVRLDKGRVMDQPG
jgi:molybdate transport system ATP-binding protein